MSHNASTEHLDNPYAQIDENDTITLTCPKCGNRFVATYTILDKPVERYLKCHRCGMVIEVVI